MTYRHATFTGHSLSLTSDCGETEHELTVHFGGEVGYEDHPYGSTTAREHITMIEDVTEILLDGISIEEGPLIEQYGNDDVKAAIEEARNGAEED